MIKHICLTVWVCLTALLCPNSIAMPDSEKQSYLDWVENNLNQFWLMTTRMPWCAQPMY